MFALSPSAGDKRTQVEVAQFLARSADLAFTSDNRLECESLIVEIYRLFDEYQAGTVFEPIVSLLFAVET